MPLEAARTWDVTARVVGVVLRFQQDEQCTYNVTLRCLRATIVAMEKQ